MATDEHRETLEGVPGDCPPLVDRLVAERYDEVTLAGPARGADHEHVTPVDPFERAQRVLSWVWDR